MGANPLSKWDTPEGESAYPTVGSNGTRTHAKVTLGEGMSGIDSATYHAYEPTGAPVAASLRQPTIARRKASELSSVERSALMDELVDQLIALKREVAGLDKRSSSNLGETFSKIREHRAMLDAHAGVLNRRTFWQRLRWLWSGV